MPSDSDIMMTTEEIRLRNLRRRRLLVGVIILVAVVAAGFFGGRPTLNAIKAWQARRHATKAFDYIEKKNWLDARKEVTAAYQLYPSEPQSVRAVARFLSRLRQPDALEVWQQLEKLTPLTRQDREDQAAVAIAAGDTTRAEAAVKALLQFKDADPTDWLLAGQLAIQKGDANEGLSSLNKIFNDPRATEAQQLQAALLELGLAGGSTATDEHAKDAWSRIQKISTGDSAAALDALVLLVRRELATGQQQEKTPSSQLAASSSELAQKLATHPLAKAPQKLLALDLLDHVDPARHDELIARGIEQFKNGDPSELVTLASWLNDKRQFQKTVDAIPVDKALQSRELFVQYLDALGGLNRWSEIKQLLESGRYPLDPMVEKMYLARCNAQLGEKTAAENNWQRALEAAGGDTGKLIALGDYAEKNGIMEVAQSAFDAAVIEDAHLRVAQQGRLRLAQRSMDTNKIHAVLADMLAIWPNDAAVQNDEGYTRLLLLGSSAGEVESEKAKVEKGSKANSDLPVSNSELQALSTLAEKLVASNPHSMPHRTFLALVRLKQNRAADALELYKNLALGPGALTPSALAVHAAVLAANGKNDDAKKEASQIRPNELLPEERALIKDLR
jgi:hypothetical protein